MLPGAVILILVVGINLLGDGLRDLLDPRLKGETGTIPKPPASKPEPLGTDATTGPLLRVERLSTRFQQDGEAFWAVQDLSFAVRKGERLAIVGESGSGKTVTALSLLGLVPPPGLVAGGRILLWGEDLVLATEERRRELRGNRIAYIAQDPMTALNPVLTVGAQLIESLRAHRDLDRHRARQRAVELLGKARIPRPAERIDAYPHELSGGMRQRVVIAIALANDPDLLIADEATTALDVTVQAEILKLLDTLCTEQGAALVFISHDLDVVAQLCDRALVMYAGRVVEEAPIATLLVRPVHPYTRALLACAPELGRPEKSLRPIPGQPPSLNDLPPGCHFAPRCPHAQSDCRREEIKLRAFGEGTRVRCVRAGELPPWRS
jgi:peptide/nickel transport system permease protein